MDCTPEVNCCAPPSKELMDDCTWGLDAPPVAAALTACCKVEFA